MPASSTADANSHVRFSLTPVKRQQVIKQIAEALQRFVYFSVGSQELNHAAIVAGQAAQLGDKMRIRQVADIKHQLEICGAAIFVAKAQNLHPHWCALFIRTESGNQMGAQRMDRVFGSINNLISQRANAFHRASLVPDGGRQDESLVGRVWPPGLAETMMQHSVGSFQKQNKDLQPFGP